MNAVFRMQEREFMFVSAAVVRGKGFTVGKGGKCLNERKDLVWFY